MNTKEILQGIKDWAAPKVIYDISAAHNNTKYTDLSDALGTNGGNIPQEYRKGGITVRYVQSSDNNYVQFRYMGTSTAIADFTNIANWQGVDNEPTAGSDNLVKSGGVAQQIGYESFIRQTNEEYQKTDNLIHFYNGAFNSQTGVKTEGDILSAEVRVPDGISDIYINVKSPATAIGLYGFDATKSDKLSYKGTVSATTVTNGYKITLPAGTVFVRITYVAYESCVYTDSNLLGQYIPYGYKKEEIDKFIHNEEWTSLVTHQQKLTKSYIWPKSGAFYPIFLFKKVKYSCDNNARLITKTGSLITVNANQPFILDEDAVTLHFAGRGNDITVDRTFTCLENLSYISLLNERNRADIPVEFVAPINKNITMNDGVPTFNETGAHQWSDYIPCSPSITIKTQFINGVYFYDRNKNYLGNGTVVASNESWITPVGTAFAIFNTLPNMEDKILPILVVDSGVDVYAIKSNFTSLRMLESNIVKSPATYIIGDSEAARLYNITENFLRLNLLCTSNGGHTTDTIANQVGIATNRELTTDNLNYQIGLVVSGTNDGNLANAGKAQSYIYQLVKQLRKKGCNQIFGLGKFCGVDITRNDYNNDAIYLAQKHFYGSHFIDQINYAFDLGYYFNFYNPETFIQPAIGNSVDITFEDVTALTECGMLSVGNDFYIRYADDKIDKYSCDVIDTVNNIITATLVVNGSGIVEGGNAGQFDETKTSGTGNKTCRTYGYVYNDSDANNIAGGYLPPSIYQDRTVHFGKIFGKIIKEMLFINGLCDMPNY